MSLPVADLTSLAEAASTSLSTALGAFTWLEETERLITLRTALPALNLVATRLVMREAEGQGFELILDAVSTSAYLPLKTLIGEQMTVGLRQADGRYAPWHGYVTEAAQLGSDGGLARYRLVMAPWVDILKLRRDSFVFQDKTVQQILDDVFADYPQAQWRWDLAEPEALRTRSLCIQYRESDWAFVQRLLASEGLSWHIEHLGDEDAATADEQGKARHVMVITDAGAERADLGPIRFAALHPTAVVAGLEDPITGFAAQRTLPPNAVALGSWNYRNLAGSSAELASALDLGEVPWLEQYDGSGAYRFADTQAAERAVRLALGALELQAKRFAGQGGARVLRAGAQFQLIDHPLYGANTTAPSYAAALTASHPRPDNAFTVLAVEHHVANNLGDQAAELLKQTALAKGGYRNQFQAVPAAAPVLPRPVRAPTAPYLLTARVVGLQDEALTTERDHRVKVQFHFQRGASPNPGGLPHAHSGNTGADEQGNAPGNEQSGTWVRVATPAAGANWGAVWVPRIGSEVAVQFIEGDIDRPIIAGGLTNGDQPPPFAAGVDAGVNHPGVLAGLHSRTLDGQDTQQWVVDDAPGQLRTRLATTHTGSELSLGHLINQSPTSAQRGAWRGSGFEANTQGWASLRAGQGLLVSTQARAGTYGSAQGAQMDAAEALAQLQSATELGQRLSQAAQAIGAQALTSTEEGQDLSKLHQALDPQQDGRHPDQVNGQDAKIPADGRDPSQGDPVPAFAQPAVVLDSAAAQLLATPASVQQFSGQRLSQIVQADLQASVAHTASIAAGQTASLYAHQGGLQVKAANGPVSLRAHTDELKLLADQSVTITSVNDEIRISANSKIELIAGQSGITLEGGNITVTTPGSFAVKGATHGFLGGGSQAASLPALPNSPPPSQMASLNEVASLKLVTALDEGSANDGTGTSTQLAMRYQHSYVFRVDQYDNSAPVDPSAIHWQAQQVLHNGSRKPVPIQAQGEQATLTVEDLELCGGQVEVRAYIQSSGAQLSVPVHNRFRWFDAKLVAEQVSQRISAPWQIDQGRSSLCGMAALFYAMAQKNPGRYQRLTTELHRKGEFTIDGYTVEPNSQVAERMYEVKASDPDFQQLSMWEADWILLATTRSGESALAFDGLGIGTSDQLKSVNWPGMMANLMEKVAGFDHAEEVDTGSVAMLIKKSWLGKLHDSYSNTDLDALITIDRRHQSGETILLMVDFGILTNEVSYSVSEVFTDSHWIVYEGGLHLFDAAGRTTQDASLATTVQFKAYSWGTNPETGEKIDKVTGILAPNDSVNIFLKNGISAAAWKSNFYGYISAK